MTTFFQYKPWSLGFSTFRNIKNNVRSFGWQNCQTKDLHFRFKSFCIETKIKKHLLKADEKERRNLSEKTNCLSSTLNTKMKTKGMIIQKRKLYILKAQFWEDDKSKMERRLIPPILSKFTLPRSCSFHFLRLSSSCKTQQKLNNTCA